METFFSQKSNPKLTKSVAANLSEALEELFKAMKTDTIVIEKELEVSTTSFIKDFLKMLDEISSEQNITDLWHIDESVAHSIFLVYNEVVFGGGLDLSLASDSEEDEANDVESDTLDQSEDSD